MHGFLQTPKVWDDIHKCLKVASEAVDLLSVETTNQDEWAEHFNDEVLTDGFRNRVLVGYSMGGRLAFHSILQNPELWDAAVIVGAHPGSADKNQRTIWLENDQSWAERFLQEDWVSLIADWDAQNVFGGVPNPCPPREQDFSRKQLAEVSTRFSKGRQRALGDELKTLSSPSIHYLSGGKDAQYSAIGMHLAQLCPAVEHCVFPQSNHRLPWEAMNDFITFLRQFI